MWDIVATMVGEVQAAASGPAAAVDR